MDFWDVFEVLLDGVGMAIGLVSLLGGALVFLVVAWFVRRVIVHHWRASGQTQTSWPRTQGVLIGNAPLRTELGDVSLLQYSFTVDGVQYTGCDDGSVAGERPGGTVPVAYNPADPSDNAIALKIASRRWTWLAMAVALAAALTASGVLLVVLGLDTLNDL